MNRQKEIVITVTYNELGIIVGTKVEPRKKGTWLDGDEMPDYPRIPYLPWMKYCSACGKLTTECDDSLYDFCPFCGADMRGEQA